MGIWGSGSNVPKTIFYLLKGDYIPSMVRLDTKLLEEHWGRAFRVKGSGFRVRVHLG